MNTGEAAQNWREPGEMSRTGSKAYTEGGGDRYSDNTSEQQRLNRAFRESEHESSSRGTGRQGGGNLFSWTKNCNRKFIINASYCIIEAW